MNSNKPENEEIARALILCANAYLEMDEDSNDEDSDFFLLEHDSYRPPKRASNAAVDMPIPPIPKWSGDEYGMYLKMSAQTFEFVYQLLAPRLRLMCHSMPMLDARLQVMVAIHKLTSSKTYRVASATFNMKKNTGYVCTNRVINALHSLAPGFIKWPSKNTTKTIAKEFEAASGFPGVLGNVGCYRLRMLEFLEKGAKEGVLFQVVCDNKKKIIHCALTPPSSNLIEQSGLAQYLNPTNFPSDTHLIANNSYPLLENIMIPYTEENDVLQKYFNKKIRSTFVIDECLGSLLGRFESLNRGLTLNERANQRHVNACCVLHNICILRNDPWDGVRPSVDVVMKETVSCLNGVKKRDAIASQLARD